MNDYMKVLIQEVTQRVVSKIIKKHGGVIAVRDARSGTFMDEDSTLIVWKKAFEGDGNGVYFTHLINWSKLDSDGTLEELVSEYLTQNFTEDLLDLLVEDQKRRKNNGMENESVKSSASRFVRVEKEKSRDSSWCGNCWRGDCHYHGLQGDAEDS